MYLKICVQGSTCLFFPFLFWCVVKMCTCITRINYKWRMGDECMHCQISISPAAFYNVLSSCYVAPAPTSEIMVHANSVMFILKIEVSDTSVLARLYLSAIPGRGVLKCLCAKYNCTTCPLINFLPSCTCLAMEFFWTIRAPHSRTFYARQFSVQVKWASLQANKMWHFAALCVYVLCV